jgi:hypothetical protein
MTEFIDTAGEFLDEDGNALEVDILALHRSREIAVLTNFQVVPVTNWFNSKGEDCTYVDAHYCVCGSDETAWFSVTLPDLEPVTVH